jgi:endonuclease YncB( thermonuclease family)
VGAVPSRCPWFSADVAIGITRTLTENGHRTARRVRLVVLAALLTLVPAVAGTEYVGKVVAIAHGDTFTLLVGREQLRIRLAEIDTPDKGQPYGNRARQALTPASVDCGLRAIRNRRVARSIPENLRG